MENADSRGGEHDRLQTPGRLVSEVYAEANCHYCPSKAKIRLLGLRMPVRADPVRSSTE